MARSWGSSVATEEMIVTRVCECIGLGLLSVGALNCAETPEQLVADAQMHLASQDLEHQWLFVAVPDDQGWRTSMVRAQAFAAASTIGCT